MVNPVNQTVYLPVKVEKDNLPTKEVCALNESNMLVGHLKYLGEGVIRPIVYIEDKHQQMGNITHWIKPQEGYFFTSEQLNEYTQSVIKQSLETAAEKAEYNTDGQEHINEVWVDKQSIINTAEETFKQFEV